MSGSLLVFFIKSLIQSIPIATGYYSRTAKASYTIMIGVISPSPAENANASVMIARVTSITTVPVSDEQVSRGHVVL
jgi:hypothetical protein